MNSQHLHRTRASVMAMALFAAVPQVQAAGTLLDALTYGSISGQLRYRYEWVDQENISKKANASTLRTQLGFLTDSYLGFNAFLQFENVAVIGQELYNSTTNGELAYPVVSDPAGTEVNQAFLSYEAGYDTTMKLGRQVIILDNQRFVGSVGWRQNEQSFNAFHAVNKSLPNTQVTYAFVNDANRITGDDAANGDLRMNTSLINLAYSGFSAGTLVGYDYLMDNDNQTLPGVPAASTQTLGLRFIGKYPLDSATLLYTAEYANQSDYADNPLSFDETYAFGEFGALMSGITAKLGYEKLGGDGTVSVQTPLATLHAFNGWADKFLTTPKDGLEDVYVSVGKKLYGVELLASYHDYSSDNLDYDYGTELDFSAGMKINKSLSLLLKYANFSGDKNTTNATKNLAVTKDVDKLWLQADVTF